MSVTGRAQTLLELVVDTADDLDYTLPARQYVAAGTPGSEAHDCPEGQVTVALAQAGGNLAVSQADGAGMSGDPSVAPLSSATYTVQVAFPHPTLAEDGTPPTVEALQAAGEASMGAADVLKRVRDRIITESALTDGAPGGVRLGPVVPSGPAGGLAAVNLTVTVDLW